MPPQPIHGLLVLDKPGGITSRGAVDQALRWLPRGTKVGHTGTLDPLATGVLVLCVGPATRLTEYVQDLPKTYETTIRLGVRSDTDDADGTITPVSGAVAPTPERVRAALDPFVGEIEQVPPTYSAAKLSGERAYDRARRGEDVSLTPRRVRVNRIEVLGYAYPELRLRIDCGKGTYIRSIARDLGARLGCGGYVDVLRRTRVGPFTPEQAVPLDADAAAALARLLPPAAAVAHLPRISVNEACARRLRNGSPLWPPSELTVSPRGSEWAAFDPAGELIGLVVRDEMDRLSPVKVLPG